MNVNFLSAFMLSMLFCSATISKSYGAFPHLKKSIRTIDTTTVTDPVYVEFGIDSKPEFVGGDKRLAKYIRNNYNIPEDVKLKGIRGTVITSFVVEKDGTLSHITVLRDLGYGTKEEAIRLLKSMPAWKPGLQRGREVRISKTLRIPVNF